jgi:hypothetical protein
MYSVLYILRQAPSCPTSRRPLLLLSTAHRLTAAKLEEEGEEAMEVEEEEAPSVAAVPAAAPVVSVRVCLAWQP